MKTWERSGAAPTLAAGLSLALALAGCAAGEDLFSDRKDSGTRPNTGGGFGNGAGGSGGGSTGTGGTGRGGSAGTGGSTGLGGASGSGGSGFGVGGGGTGGSRFLGSGGSPPSDGGSSGGGDFSDAATSMGLAVTFVGQTPGIMFTAKIVNNGTDMPPVSALKIRYYFSDESYLDPSMADMHFDYAAWNAGQNAPQNGKYNDALNCTGVLVKLMPAVGMTDSYFEMGCTSTFPYVINAGDNEEIHFRLQTGFEDPTNDYSFVAPEGGTSGILADHIVLLQNGALAWGTAP